jgi:hypothetical protein
MEQHHRFDNRYAYPGDAQNNGILSGFDETAGFFGSKSRARNGRPGSAIDSEADFMLDDLGDCHDRTRIAAIARQGEEDLPHYFGAKGCM